MVDPECIAVCYWQEEEEMRSTLGMKPRTLCAAGPSDIHNLAV